MKTDCIYSETVFDRVWSGPHYAEVMFDGSVLVSLHTESTRSVKRRLKKKAAKKFDKAMDDLVVQAEKNVAAMQSEWEFIR